MNVTDPNAGLQVQEVMEETKHDEAEAAFAGRSPMQIAMSRLRRDKLAMICLVVVVFFVFVAVFADVIAKVMGVSLDTVTVCEVVECNHANPNAGLPLSGPPVNGFDADHPLGINPRTGSDNLAHWIFGARTSLMIAGIATLFASVVGILLGLVAGFMGGWVDKVIMFITDFFLTIPFLLAALAIAPIINDRFALSDNYPTIQKFSLIAVLAVFGWMGVARLVRGEVMSLREREFVHAARVIGMPTGRILFKELLPNLVAPIIISVSLMLPTFVALEAGLAFLGIGVTDGASWGQTILNAVPYWKNYPFFLAAPMVGVVALVLALNLLGDAVRDALDPKTRR